MFNTILNIQNSKNSLLWKTYTVFSMLELQTTGGRQDAITRSDDILFYVITIKFHWCFAERKSYEWITFIGNQHHQANQNRWRNFRDELTDNAHNVFATSYPASMFDHLFILYCNYGRDLTMDWDALQEALSFVWIITHKFCTTVILTPFHLVSHHTMLLCNQDVSFYNHAHFYAQESFYFRDSTSYPTERRLPTSGAVPPADKLYSTAKDCAKNGAPWLCGNFSCTHAVSVALHSGEPVLTHFTRTA
jgi:hypothetical protein